MFFLGQIGLGWVRGQSKVALKKKGALFGHSSNGVEGEVLEFDASAGRWKIHLHTVVLALKASNLVRRRRRNLLARALARAHHGAFLSCENLTAFLAPVAGTYDVRPFSHRSIGLSPGLPAGG